MSDKDKLRRLKYLLYKHHQVFYSYLPREEALKLYKEYKDSKTMTGRGWERITEHVEIYKLSDDLKLLKEELYRLWNKATIEKALHRDEYIKKPQKEGRDNKDVYVGNGGSNRNRERYPSKKRSTRTWKKFYKLFPRLAEADGWDGHTSKKMK